MSERGSSYPFKSYETSYHLKTYVFLIAEAETYNSVSFGSIGNHNGKTPER